MMLNNCALEDGFSMPFEGEEHEATIVLLPYRKDTWQNGGKNAMDAFLSIVKAISKYEMVYLGVDPSIDEKTVTPFLMNRVKVLRIPYNDSWARDNTLVFVKKGKEVRGVDFGFNAWGGSFDGLYEDYEKDNALGSLLSNKLRMDYYAFKDFILEGGSIHTNGKGTLLVTKACLLSKGRNPKLSKQEIENKLKSTLGMKKVIWLTHGIVNDETDEHVDNFACFANSDTILLATSTSKEDLQYQYSKEAYHYLSHETDQDGNPFKIILLPTPQPYLKLTKEEANAIQSEKGAKPRCEGERLAASYINFYQSKDFVLLPQFGVKEDEQAYQIVKSVFPHKEIFRIPSRSILTAGGNIHCVTMQIPKGD